MVDQFEEIFTACRDEAEQHRFIAAVCALSGPAAVVLALRADFYDRALQYPELARALQEHQVVVGPMTRGEVRRAIVEPARLARLEVEDGLVELLLRDLAPHSPDWTPGARTRPAPCRCSPTPCSPPGRAATAAGSPWLTTRPAGASGTRSPGRPTRSTGRWAMISGTSPGGSSCAWCTWPTTHRRRAARCRWTSCGDWPGETASPGEVLDRFVAERLITVDADTAQITHEALLTAWPLLRTWIDDNRESLRVRRRLSDAARAWGEAGRDPAALLRGGQLALARDWAADRLNRDSLSPLARDSSRPASRRSGCSRPRSATARGGCAASSRPSPCWSS